MQADAAVEECADEAGRRLRLRGHDAVGAVEGVIVVTSEAGVLCSMEREDGRECEGLDRDR